MKKRHLFLIALSIFIGVLSTHYLENIETPLLMKVRNIVYLRSFSEFEMDESGDYIRKLKDGRPVFNPVSYSQIALSAAQKVLEDSLKADYIEVENFRRNDDLVIEVANKLFAHIDTILVNNKISAYAFRYNFDYDYGTIDVTLKSGWVSGMAQAHATQIILASYILTKDDMYLDVAEKALNLLEIPIIDGGTNEKLNSYENWYEEYASDTYKYSAYPRVLNGHIFAMDGLYYLSLVSKDKKYSKMYDMGLDAVENNIKKYSIGVFWSRYDMVGTIANASYHNIHIHQLKRIMTSDTCNIKRQYSKFLIGKFIPIGVFLRLFYVHNLMLLSAIFLNSLITYLLLMLIILIKRTNENMSRNISA